MPSFAERRTRHYWIENASSYRVEVAPDRRVASLVGERVVAVGHFRFDSDQRRTITVDRVESADVTE